MVEQEVVVFSFGLLVVLGYPILEGQIPSLLLGEQVELVVKLEMSARQLAVAVAVAVVA
jgi:hypothetical protein